MPESVSQLRGDVTLAGARHPAVDFAQEADVRTGRREQLGAAVEA